MKQGPLLIWLLLTAGNASCESTAWAKVTVQIFTRGLAKSAPVGIRDSLVRETEQLLVSADGRLRMVISRDLIRKLKREETCVELRYSEVQRRTVMGSDIIFTRLLVPLSGSWGPPRGTVMYSGTIERKGVKMPFSELDDYRSVNMVNNSRGSGQIREILTNSGMQFE